MYCAYIGKKLELNNRKLSYDPSGTWDHDQLIMTRAILESKLCYFPVNNSLWSLLRMNPIIMQENSDQSTCFHGHDLDNCHQQNFLQKKKCLWWHFFPSDGQKNLHQKYFEILNDLNISKI